MIKDLSVTKIEIITYLGPRTFIKGNDFEYVQYQQIDEDSMHITLWNSNDQLVNFIHANTPIVIDYNGGLNG